MVRIGLTGGPGSGKSTVAKIFVRRGVKIIDLDYLARLAVEPGKPAYKKILEKFGDKASLDSGELDRKYLRECLIKNPEDKKKLEEILHPEIFSLLGEELSRLEKQGVGVVVVEAPLLFETNMMEKFDILVTVFVSPDIQLERLMKRDKVTFESAMGLIRSQMDLKSKADLSDHVIYNERGVDCLKTQVDEFFGKYGIAT